MSSGPNARIFGVTADGLSTALSSPMAVPPFAQPTNDFRDRCRAGLLYQAALVRTYGWAPYRAVWSSGEVLGVAALLQDHKKLASDDETLQSAWLHWAYALWGLAEGQNDVDNDCRATRRWFLDAASRYGRNVSRDDSGGIKKARSYVMGGWCTRR